jgi:hypothetical protein
LFECHAEPKGIIAENIFRNHFRCDELIERSIEAEWVSSASIAENLTFNFSYGNEIFWVLPGFAPLLFHLLDSL